MRTGVDKLSRAPRIDIALLRRTKKEEGLLQGTSLRARASAAPTPKPVGGSLLIL
jgi:hypothetical protein